MASSATPSTLSVKIVSKNLSITDVEKRLTIPSKSLHCFPSLRDKHMVEFQARDEGGHVWTFAIYCRKMNSLSKPVLTKGWREFVRSKELRVGDRVTFYMDKEEAGAVKYRVEVEKAVKIFGAVFAREPIHSVGDTSLGVNDIVLGVHGENESEVVGEPRAVAEPSQGVNAPRHSQHVKKVPGWFKEYI
ncbi:hypothetical protein PTKIN_Ptkin10aG0190100 [Pterospermum kingtungense]